MPELPKNCVFYTRRFLNRPGYESIACILASLENRGYMELKISDCSRSVSLSLSEFESENNLDYFENSLEKLEIIEKTCKALRLAAIKQAKSKGYKPREKK